MCVHVFLGYFLHKYKTLKFKYPRYHSILYDSNIHYEIVQTLYIPPINLNWTNYILHAGKVSIYCHYDAIDIDMQLSRPLLQ